MLYKKDISKIVLQISKHKFLMFLKNTFVEKRGLIIGVKLTPYLFFNCQVDFPFIYIPPCQVMFRQINMERVESALTFHYDLKYFVHRHHLFSYLNRNLFLGTRAYFVSVLIKDAASFNQNILKQMLSRQKLIVEKING